MSAAITKHDARAALASQTQVLKQNLKTPIPAPRIALERKISIRFPHFQGFLTETSSNISITGMFVRARFPQRPGTILDFEFNLHDGLKLIRGTGEVVWVRKKEDGDLPAGMGIRFLRLDPESRRLIRWAVEKQIDDGVEPFDLDALREAAKAPEPASASRSTPPLSLGPAAPGAVAPGGVHKIYPYAGYAKARGNPSLRWLPAAGAGALALVLLASIPLVRPSDAAGSATTPVPGAAEAQAPVPSRPTPNAAGTRPAVDTTTVAASVVDATEAWARAWGEQRAADYLAFYSPRFRPPDSLRHGDWEALRRSRIERPDFIQVGILGLEAELLGGERARVRFDQAYRSDSYRDATRKTLELVLEDGSWKILEERSGD